MLKIDETFDPGGAPTAVFLRADEGALVLVADDGAFPLPARALDAVMARFGLPVEPSERLAPVGELALGDGRALRHVRHLGPYDVIARDYLVYEAGGGEPVCALAVTVAAALGHLARAAARAAPAAGASAMTAATGAPTATTAAPAAGALATAVTTTPPATK